MRSTLNLQDLVAAAQTIPIPLDSVRVELRRVSDENAIVFEETFPVDQVLTGNTVDIEIAIVILTDPEEFLLHLEILGNGFVWYEVIGTVTASARDVPPSQLPPPTYVGPGANADSVRMTLMDTTLAGGDSVLVSGTVYESNAVVPGAPVSFTSSNTAYGAAYAWNAFFADANVGQVTRVTPSGPGLDELGSLTTAFPGGLSGLIGLTEGPDGFLYASTTDGDIYRLELIP